MLTQIQVLRKLFSFDFPSQITLPSLQLEIRKEAKNKYKKDAFVHHSPNGKTHIYPNILR